jgi:hypothetical protein
MMMRTSVRYFALPLLVPLLFASDARPQAPCVVDGHSYMVLVKAAGLAGVNDYVNLVSVPTGGGAEVSTLVDTAALPIPLPLPVRATLVSNSTVGDESECSASSFSSLTDVSVDVFGLVTITADLIQAATEVSSDSCTAGTKVVNLAISVLGMPVGIPDPIAPNTVIPLGPLGSVTLKEERCGDSEASAAVIRVVANVVVPLLASESVEVVISRASSVASSAGGPPSSDPSTSSPQDPLSGLGLESLLGLSQGFGGLGI